MSDWHPAPDWKPSHQIGAVVYMRVEVTGFGKDGELRVRPIQSDRSAFAQPGEFWVLEEWVFPGSVIVDAIQRGVKKSSRIGY